MKKLSPEWDQRYFELAKYISRWSKDPKAKIGVVILDERTWPIALGYNGFPSGVEDKPERLTDPELKPKMVVHAEQNALLFAGSRARGGVLFVYGRPVCPGCAGAIIQAGISRVVGIVPNPQDNPDSTTHREGHISLTMFAEAGVEFSPYSPPEELV